MKKYYFEDFAVGQIREVGSRVVDATEVVAFATAYDPQPFHIDAEAAKASPFGGLIASGWHTAAMVMRLMCDGYLLDAAGTASPGVDELRWLAPVRPGDTLTARAEVLEVTPSRSKPDRGMVRSLWTASNQDGVLVFSVKGIGIFMRRPA
jgi:acyl dehydratase